MRCWKQHWACKRKKMEWQKFVGLSRRRTGVSRGSYVCAYAKEVTTELAKKFRMDTGGHELIYIRTPRVITVDGVKRHQLAGSYICTKCGRVTKTLTRLPGCGVKSKP